MKMYEKPDYNAIFEKRKKNFLKIYKSPTLIKGANEYYKTRTIEFIEDWGITYDPRNVGSGHPTLMPFVLFERQKQFIEFLYDCVKNQENGGCEKCRDAGVTWLAVNFAVWMYKFHDGSSVGFGSRKEQLVDKLGDPDSIFEKIRMVINNLPSFFKPKGFDAREHMTYMKIINPENLSTITGEAGDNIGRGGRKSVYFKDESAFYERPEKIEASLGDNTNVQIDISSVNGPATVFTRRIESGEHWSPGVEMESGITRIFIFDWRNVPWKTQEWYNRRKSKAEREGLLHVFASEVDRDTTAAVEGVLIMGKWAKACIDAHKVIGFEAEGMSISAQDVADEGADKHALAMRKGIVLNHIDDWPNGDVGVATRKVVFHLKRNKVKLHQYDCIGVGAGVKSETNRLKNEKLLPKYLKIVPWHAGSSPLRPKARVIPGDKDSPINKDFYKNLKAQGWWQLRTKCEKTYKVVNGIAEYPVDELISFDGRMEKIQQLVKELSQPTYSHDSSGKIVIDKKPDGTKSPNLADAVVMCYWPKTPKKVLI